MNYDRCKIKKKKQDFYTHRETEVMYSTDCIEVLVLKDRINDLQRYVKELQKQGEEDEIQDN